MGQRAIGEDPSSAHVQTLAAAILRIGTRLDLDPVLREVVKSARTPTRVGHSVIATADEAGRYAAPGC